VLELKQPEGLGIFQDQVRRPDVVL